MTGRTPFGRPAESKVSLGFKLWFAFCALLGVGVLVVAVALAIATIGWLNRN